ncbi:MAG: OmpA family protein [Desulfobacterales bacterium]|nr:MAG: OmpA family protein [Desulfobacterales bacterium]
MNEKSAQLTLVMLVILVFTVGGGVQAGEIIYADDIRENVINKEVLVRTADNVIVLVDTSSSMAATNKTYKKSYYELEQAALTTGFARLPDLGYNVGVYRFTPWEVLYPMQKFDAAGVADALKKFPAEPEGRTPLVQSLNELESVLKGLSGKTVVYIFSDGGYDKLAGSTSPGEKTTVLAKKYDVCFQVIDYSVQERDRKTVSDMSRANMCSRAIPFDSYITQPYYALGPLYYTRWDTEVETLSERKVAGYKVNNILFELDKSDLSAAGQEELTAVGKFMVEKPSAYTVLHGYTDDTGRPEYNVELSRRRAEAVADYLYNNFNLGPDRVISLWYGAANPIASNDTEAGRSKNRRVEVSIGGL